MEHSLNKLVEELESWIRAGEGQKARDEIERLDLASLPRPFVSPIAALARRVDMSDQAIAMLHPFVGSVSGEGAATPAEAAEYAAALTYLGASREAREILKELDTAAVPKALLYLGYAYFAEWDYRSSLAPLKQYLRTEGLDPYWKLVGQINLASALIHERLTDTVETILAELLESTHLKHYHLHRAKTLELLATNSIERGNWADAQKYLFESRAMLRSAAPVQRLYLKKWRAVIRLKKEGPHPEALSVLAEVKRLARSNGQWETLRDCDRHEALALQDEKLLHHVYFGTPFPRFRDRLRMDFGRPLEIPPFYRRRIDEPAEEAEGVREIDVDALRASGIDEEARPIRVLSSDFYNGFRVPLLASVLSDGQPFHPVRSPARVSSALEKLHSWFGKKGIPLQVETQGGVLRLRANGPVSLRVSSRSFLENEDEALLRKSA